MKHVILTVGPQYAGKSTFCKAIVAAHPHVAYVSRDEILIELYGSIYLNRYSCGYSVALHKMWRVVSELLNSREDVTLILDAWNIFADYRFKMVKKLRDSLYVDRVDAWYFVTPEIVCYEWSLKREPLPYHGPTASEMAHDSRRHHLSHSYRLFHRQLLDDGLFDNVLEIDSCQQFLFPLSEVFNFQGQS